jgi:hypothetical protein
MYNTTEYELDQVGIDDSARKCKIKSLNTLAGRIEIYHLEIMHVSL